jgi:hypothetical protein
MSKIMTDKEKNLQWLKNEIEFDEREINREKMEFISQIKKLKKEDIIPTKEEKISLWQRIKKVFLGI